MSWKPLTLEVIPLFFTSLFQACSLLWVLILHDN